MVFMNLTVNAFLICGFARLLGFRLQQSYVSFRQLHTFRRKCLWPVSAKTGHEQMQQFA
jgi:hypothetical protein